MSGLSAATAPGAALPRLRAELQLLAAADGRASATATLFDPFRSRYFRIDAATAELLSLWPCAQTAGELSALAAERFALHAGEAEIGTLATFLRANGLTEPSSEEDWRRLAAEEMGSRKSWLSLAIHNYLFMRIPLIAPEPYLLRIAPVLEPLFSPAARAAVLCVGLAGLYLVSRQWDIFLATFPHQITLEGAILFAAALAVLKSLHELGHALTALRYGCRIPTMGICFMVLVPMLYTDVSDAWRLPSRRQRLAIDAAGIIVELSVAALATFAWAFLPDGPARSLAFVFATTSWIMSVGLNLNPFMRFDGYYILCDASGIENLQPRAFRLGVWRLREALFGLGSPPPERFGHSRECWIIAYAWATWIYRLVVFTGIALLVYHMAFKLLGIVLFLIEIVYFIARPVALELREWWTLRNKLRLTRRAGVTLTVLSGLVLAMIVPLPVRIAVPAVVEHAGLERLYPRRAARIAEIGVTRGARVEPGTLIARLISPDLEQEQRETQLELDLIRWRLGRLAGDAVDRAGMLVLEDELRSLETKQAGLAAEQRELTLVAGAPALVAELGENLHPGRWVTRTDLIALLRAENGRIVRGYVPEHDLGRLDPEAPGSFVPEDATRPKSEVRIGTIAITGARMLEIPELSSRYGGAIAARPRDDGGSGRADVPEAGQYQLTGEVIAPDMGPDRAVRGTLLLPGRPESLAARSARQILKVLIRESGA